MMIQVRDVTRIEQLEFGVKFPAEKIVLGRYKNRWAANIWIINGMRLCGLGYGMMIKEVKTVTVVHLS
jgi:hypothetical protein